MSEEQNELNIDMSQSPEDIQKDMDEVVKAGYEKTKKIDKECDDAVKELETVLKKPDKPKTTKKKKTTVKKKDEKEVESFEEEKEVEQVEVELDVTQEQLDDIVSALVEKGPVNDSHVQDLGNVQHGTREGSTIGGIGRRRSVGQSNSKELINKSKGVHKIFPERSEGGIRSTHKSGKALFCHE